jgi:hypothetical protein
VRHGLHDIEANEGENTMHASETFTIASAPRAEKAAGAGFLVALSGFAATFRVAIAWSNHSRARPADLAVVGFDKEFEDRVMGLSY